MAEVWQFGLGRGGGPARGAQDRAAPHRAQARQWRQVGHQKGRPGGRGGGADLQDAVADLLPSFYPSELLTMSSEGSSGRGSAGCLGGCGGGGRPPLAHVW